MKRNKLVKKIMTGVLCGVLATTSTFATNIWETTQVAMAATISKDGFYATLGDSGELKIVKMAATSSTKADNGQSVPPWWSNRSAITSVSVMISYSDSENYFFYGLSEMTTISFGKEQNLTGAVGMFEGCSGLTEIDLSKLKSNGAISLKDMFKNCTSLKKVTGLGNLTANDLSGMFEGCTGLTEIDLTDLKTSGTVSLKNMFKNCTNLKKVTGLGGLTTSDLSGMFEGCANLESVDLNGVKAVTNTDMNNMFKSCTKLTILDCSGMTLDGINNTSDALAGCSSLQEIYMPANVGVNIALPDNGVWHSEDTVLRTEVLAQQSTSKTYSTIQFIPTPTPMPTLTSTPCVSQTPASDDNSTQEDSSKQSEDKNFINTGIYKDSGCSQLVATGEAVSYVNGGNVKQADGSKVDYKNKTYYTNLEATDIVTTDSKGKTKTKAGKIVVGITTSSEEPTLQRGKIIDKDAAKIAKATINKGKIKVIAQKLGGTVYLWAKDTGDGGESVCMRLTVKTAPTTLAVYSENMDDSKYSNKTKQYKNGDIQVGSGSSIYLYPYYKLGKTVTRAEDATYTIKVQEKWASYFTVEQDQEDPYYFIVYAKALNGEKKVSAGIIIQCVENGKKATFRATAVNKVMDIQLENSTNVTLDKKNTAVTITSSAIKKTQGTVEVVAQKYKEDVTITDKPKLYAMGSVDGYDATKLKDGKVKITVKPDTLQKKITAKLEKDKKTITVTAAKDVPDDVTVYYLLVYNTEKEENVQGYQVISITSVKE